jgi:hypothetical protein
MSAAHEDGASLLRTITASERTSPSDYRHHRKHGVEGKRIYAPSIKKPVAGEGVGTSIDPETTDTDEQPVNLSYSLATPRLCCNQSLLRVTTTGNFTPEL